MRAGRAEMNERSSVHFKYRYGTTYVNGFGLWHNRFRVGSLGIDEEH